MVMHMHPSSVLLASFLMQPMLVDFILEVQMEDRKLRIIKSNVEKGLNINFSNRKNEALMYGGMPYVPNLPELKKEILDEAHSLMYAMHSKSTKIYQTLIKYYQWIGMKRSHKILIKMLDLSTSKDGKIEPLKTISTHAHPHMEGGAHHYRFCNETPSHNKKI